MHGNKGIYELVYFVKESKAIERFKKQAQEFDKVTIGKTNEEIERLVYKILINNSDCSFGKHSNTVPLSMVLIFQARFLTKTYHGISLKSTLFSSKQLV